MGAGIVVYEIQQPSNVTYRLDDWGRVDAAGMPRELHLTEGLDVLDASSRPEPAPALSLPATGRGRDFLVATQYFALERLATGVNDVIRLAGVESPQVLTCLAGAADVDALGWVSELSQGQTMVVPSATKATLSGGDGSVIMRGWVPDLETDVFAPS
jgi:mannose-6-phosphate isomerase